MRSFSGLTLGLLAAADDCLKRPVLAWIHFPMVPGDASVYFENLINDIEVGKQNRFENMKFGFSIYGAHDNVRSPDDSTGCALELFDFDAPAGERTDRMRDALNQFTEDDTDSSAKDPLSALPSIARNRFPPQSDGDDTLRVILVVADSEPKYRQPALDEDEEDIHSDLTCDGASSTPVQLFRPLHEAKIWPLVVLGEAAHLDKTVWEECLDRGQVDSERWLYPHWTMTDDKLGASLVDLIAARSCSPLPSPFIPNPPTINSTAPESTTLSDNTAAGPEDTTNSPTLPSTKAATSENRSKPQTEGSIIPQRDTPSSSTARPSAQKNSQLPVGRIAGASAAGVALIAGLAYSVLRGSPTAADVDELEPSDASAIQQAMRDSIVGLDEASFAA